jgi:hypothetical protein
MTTGAKIAIIATSVLLIGGGIFGYFYFKRKEQLKEDGQGIKDNLKDESPKRVDLIALKKPKPIKEKIVIPYNIRELYKI